MKISDMDKKVDILIKNDNTDSPFESEYKNFIANIWAKREQLVGAQLIQALGESNKIPCNFIIRRNDKVTNKMFVKCNEKIYDIVSAVPLKGNISYTILTCYEVN